jgi:ribosomal protein S27E
VNGKNEHDDTALMCASRDGRLDMVRSRFIEVQWSGCEHEE